MFSCGILKITKTIINWICSINFLKCISKIILTKTCSIQRNTNATELCNTVDKKNNLESICVKIALYVKSKNNLKISQGWKYP